jgi:predicted peptidase
MKNLLISCLLVLMMTATGNADDAEQSEKHLDANLRVEIDYLLYLPENYQSKQKWPLMLFLHGAGERGNDLEKVKRHGPPKLVDQGKEFPCIVVSPQCKEGVWWEPTELTVLLDELEKQYSIDPDRIYVTGLSMGGFGTWRLAAYTPDRFAAIAPICGGGEPYWARTIHEIPTWVFHGAKDSVVSVERSEEMVQAIREAGGEPKVTIYPDAGHDSWTETYNNPQFYEWLFRQARRSE